MTPHRSPKSAPFGTILGYAPGQIPVYSSDYTTIQNHELTDRAAYRHTVDGIYMGYKWQCVEFARRWLYFNRGLIFDEVAMAYELFQIRSIRRVADGARLPMRAFRNGSKRLPEVGSLLIWNEGGEFEETGHVAVITEICFPDRIRIVEQNFHHEVWPADQTYSREIQARLAYDGGFWLRCQFQDGTILGWVVQTDDDQHAERPIELDPQRFNLHERQIDMGQVARQSWLNEANPDEAAFVAMMGGHRMVEEPDNEGKYIVISESATREVRRATNELHGLFMHATDWVLQDDSRLKPFNLPPALWPRIRRSWENRRNEMLTGRFDFCVTDQGVKAFEYNCDSASCYMECGKVQGRWAEHVGCTDGDDAGEHLFDRLVDAWRGTGIDDALHIMHDDDPEETFHALYMRDAIEAAGISVKMLRGVAELGWGPDGTVVDADGVTIKWVWKTWAWETALDQIRAECEADDLGLRQSGTPRLVDVLLRTDVRVYEPLWTLIPSNKAILPVLWA
ncbi:MAG: glutathionylspermidine synthase family protein, partial [Verrucomicrobia bacterium]|nr:glutathionylspermidine synthase family protein [Verrucomicrobiota bacterium]